MTLVVSSRRRTPATEEDSAIALRRYFAEIIESETGLRGPLNDALTVALVAGLRRRFPSERIYIPSPRTQEVADRKARVIEALKTKTYGEVAALEKIGERAVRKIEARARVLNL